MSYVLLGFGEAGKVRLGEVRYGAVRYGEARSGAVRQARYGRLGMVGHG